MDGTVIAAALYAYLHFAAILTLASALGAQALLLRAEAGPKTVRALTRTDILYGISAVAVIATGIVRILFGGKAPETYLLNPVFWTKMALVTLLAVLSVAPTLRFRRWHHALASDPAFSPDPREFAAIRRLVFAQLHILALIPLPAVLMARGIGL